jgi:hypothetical protein
MDYRIRNEIPISHVRWRFWYEKTFIDYSSGFVEILSYKL